MTRRESLEQRWQRMSLIENELRAAGISLIAGVDEAGRGPLAGPVAVAAVILSPDARILGLNDSKKLSEKQRLALEPIIKEQAVAWNVTMIDHEVIDKINILQATKLGMRQAVAALEPPAAYLLVDGTELDGVELPQQGLIKGDARSVSIAAASVLAKTARDRLMIALDSEYPGYGFARHKGYPTAEHKEALRRLGPCPIHRLTFKY
ncbi:MAG: ribonuclease HII [Firmicutes bacterium]|nr:ribonuclease HII [Bacillota bacterium]